MLTLRQVLDLAEAIDARYRALILLAVFDSLRWAELAALRRCDIDSAPPCKPSTTTPQPTASPAASGCSGRSSAESTRTHHDHPPLEQAMINLTAITGIMPMTGSSPGIRAVGVAAPRADDGRA